MGYRISIAARADLLDLYNYGLIRFGERSAQRYQLDLIALFEKLAQFPSIGTVHTGTSRRFPHWPYIIIYSPSGRGGIFIERIIHGRQDWQRD